MKWGKIHHWIYFVFIEGVLLITKSRGKLLLDKASRCAWCDEALLGTLQLPLNCGNLNSPARQSPAWINVYKHTVNKMVKPLTQPRYHHHTSRVLYLLGVLTCWLCCFQDDFSHTRIARICNDTWLWKQLCHGAWTSLYWSPSTADTLGQKSWLRCSQWELCMTVVESVREVHWSVSVESSAF